MPGVHVVLSRETPLILVPSLGWPFGSDEMGKHPIGVGGEENRDSWADKQREEREWQAYMKTIRP